MNLLSVLGIGKKNTKPLLPKEEEKELNRLLQRINETSLNSERIEHQREYKEKLKQLAGSYTLPEPHKSFYDAQAK